MVSQLVRLVVAVICEYLSLFSQNVQNALEGSRPVPNHERLHRAQRHCRPTSALGASRFYLDVWKHTVSAWRISKSFMEYHSSAATCTWWWKGVDVAKLEAFTSTETSAFTFTHASCTALRTQQLLEDSIAVHESDVVHVHAAFDIGY